MIQSPGSAEELVVGTVYDGQDDLQHLNALSHEVYIVFVYHVDPWRNELPFGCAVDRTPGTKGPW